MLPCPKLSRGLAPELTHAQRLEISIVAATLWAGVAVPGIVEMPRSTVMVWLSSATAFTRQYSRFAPVSIVRSNPYKIGSVAAVAEESTMVPWEPADTLLRLAPSVDADAQDWPVIGSVLGSP